MSKLDTALNLLGKALFFAMEYSDKKADRATQTSYKQRKELEHMANRSDLTPQQREEIERRQELLDRREEILDTYYTNRDNINQVINDAYETQNESYSIDKRQEAFDKILLIIIRSYDIFKYKSDVETAIGEQLIVHCVNERLKEEEKEFNIELAKKYILEYIEEFESEIL